MVKKKAFLIENDILMTRFILFIICLFNVKPLIAESQCDRLLGAKQYQEAISYCEAEGNNSSLGWIYHSLKNCSLMEKYFSLAEGTYYLDTITHNFLFGNGGCSVDLEKALKYNQRSLDRAPNNHSLNLRAYIEMAKDGIRWRDTPNYTGFKYFIKSIKEERNIFSEERDKRAIKDSLEKARAYINNSDKEWSLNYILDKILEGNQSKKLEELVLSYKDTFARLETDTFEKYKSYITKFPDSDVTTYLEGRLFEMGIGRIENLEEAYRLYLLASAMGSLDAAYAKDRIRDSLTEEEIETAKCLAKKGRNPSWISRQFCK